MADSVRNSLNRNFSFSQKIYNFSKVFDETVRAVIRLMSVKERTVNKWVGWKCQNLKKYDSDRTLDFPRMQKKKNKKKKNNNKKKKKRFFLDANIS